MEAQQEEGRQTPWVGARGAQAFVWKPLAKLFQLGNEQEPGGFLEVSPSKRSQVGEVQAQSCRCLSLSLALRSADEEENTTPSSCHAPYDTSLRCPIPFLP